MTFQQQMQAIQRNAQRHEARMLQASRNVLEGVGKDSIPFMVTNAPWRDRLPEDRPQNIKHARELLDYAVLHPSRLHDGGKIALVQGATYGWALELAHGSKYQILQTTWALFGAEFRRRLSEVWRT